MIRFYSRFGTGILAALLMLLAAWSTLGERSTSAQQAADKAADIPQPIVNTHELMELFNQPMYQLLKAEMDKGLDDPQRWSTIHDRGLQAAEVANLVALRKSDPQWQSLAGEMQQAGVQLAEAAERKDKELTRKSYRQLIERCNACHQKIAPQEAPSLEP